MISEKSHFSKKSLSEINFFKDKSILNKIILLSLV